MPVLMLARGDKDARDLLRKAIEARYGNRPPAFDSLKVDFSGRVHTRIGPIKTWVPLDVTAQFHMPNQMRWDFTAKPAGVPVRRGVEAYDGTNLRTLSGSKPKLITDENAVSSLQRRLWAIAALLLTPLGDHFVDLNANGERALIARNTQTDAAVDIQLMEAADDNRLREVSVDCFNPDQNKQQRFILQPSEELASFDGLLLPTKVTAFWDDTEWFEMEPMAAESDPEIEEIVFTLGAKSAENS
jgi:hypothetical protein